MKNLDYFIFFKGQLEERGSNFNEYFPHPVTVQIIASHVM